ncbi:MAG: Mitochondrial 28S ribosomal protein S31 [Paramarteilia canceri]
MLKVIWCRNYSTKIPKKSSFFNNNRKAKIPNFQLDSKIKLIDKLTCDQNKIEGEKFRNISMKVLNLTSKKNHEKSIKNINITILVAKRVVEQSKKKNFLDLKASDVTEEENRILNLFKKKEVDFLNLEISKEVTDMSLNSKIVKSQILDIFSPKIHGSIPEDSKTEFESTLDEYLQFDNKMMASSGLKNLAKKTRESQLRKLPISSQEDHPLAKEEENITFTEHIMISRKFWSWAKDNLDPEFTIFSNSNVKNFMDLILLSLSNNPYISLKEKWWYLEYFIKYFKENKNLFT